MILNVLDNTPSTGKTVEDRSNVGAKQRIMITKQQFRDLFVNGYSYDAYKENPAEGFTQYVGGGLNAIIDLAEKADTKMVKNCLYYGDFVFIASCDPRGADQLLICHENAWGAISLKTATLKEYILDAAKFTDFADIRRLGEFLQNVNEAAKYLR